MFSTIGNEIIIRISRAPHRQPAGRRNTQHRVFGVKFTGAVQLILGGLWALALLILAGYFIWNLMKWGIARNRGHSDDIEEGAAGAKKTGIAFGAAAGASVILGGILALATAAGA